MIHPKLANWVVGIVTVVWLVNFMATIPPWLHYRPDPAIHGVFMLVVGGALALKRGKNEDDSGEQ